MPCALVEERVGVGGGGGAGREVEPGGRQVLHPLLASDRNSPGGSRDWVSSTAHHHKGFCLFVFSFSLRERERERESAREQGRGTEGKREREGERES